MQNPSPQKWYANLPRVAGHFLAEETRRGTLFKTLALSLARRELRFAESATLDSLLRRQASENGSAPFIHFAGRALSFAEIDDGAGRLAAALERRGFKPGTGLALMLENSPDFLTAYFATQRAGLYAVPLNTALVGDGLGHALANSRVRGLVIEEGFLPSLAKVRKSCPELREVIVRRADPSRRKTRSAGSADFDALLRVGKTSFSGAEPPPEAVSTILYTSGTTGAPKGVVYKYGADWLRKAGLLQNLIHNPDDILYTCLPLFHANALFLTLSASLWLGLPVVLSRRFSAGNFWNEIREHGATVFNAVGAMIPILLKNPPSARDRDNPVRLVLSAACPADCWREFEARFGVTIWEGYSAVDGGQNFIFNFGNAPVGSLGKMSFSKFRIVNAEGRDAQPFEKGELVFRARGRGSVEYFRDAKATREKIRNGYVRTGDLVYRDDKGFLYFAGRNTDSMRRRGENVSAHEVESVFLAHPDVLECAAYGVASELAEQDIMCAVVPVAGRKVDPAALLGWAGKRLARHALPRYVRVLAELPKTPTLRVVKAGLVAEGVTSDAYDAESRRAGRAG